MLESIKYFKGSLKILDQTLLPHETIYVPVLNTNEGWCAINLMKVRGAPAIAIVGCLSLAVELTNKDLASFPTKKDLFLFIQKQLKYLVTARPTAINLQNEVHDLIDVAKHFEEDDQLTVEAMVNSIVEIIEGLLEKDVADNQAIGSYGAETILQMKSNKVIILTHCNTGSLATAGYGTALGVIRSLYKQDKLEHVFFTETRPYMQGSRLTSYELLSGGIPSTLVCDSAVAFLFKQRSVSAVVVGADRVAANGDTANKIGTYQIAVSAKHHKVPFYIAAPTSSIDFSIPSGDKIPIEERSSSEMTTLKNNIITPLDVKCWNPSFDITPADLITAIITEKGVYPPGKLQALLHCT